METNNETVEQVCSVLYTYPKAEVCDGSVLTVLNNDKIADRILAAHKREIAELRDKLKVAEEALEKIDNMCDGDMCKHFDNTHHCSACKYLDKCQTGVAHAALVAIREKGANNGK